ncbi:MAG: hypothetical protein IJS14_13100 [Lentisphaeria bacterium]|nr:hypothetical protein [Lentisphaeria bacterium]
MIIFITAVLVMAALQSFSKLALLPRKWEMAAAVLLFPLPFLFESSIARTSMQTLNAALSSAGTLENWCALVVIQELFTLVVGFSLLDDTSREEKPKQGLRRYLKYLKYLVFLPSVLLPAGVLYLQMYLFNALPGMKFRTLSWLLAGGLPLLAVLIPESVRLLRRDREARILTVLHAEYFLVLPAVFLPVAANARLIPDGGGDFPADSLLVLAALAIFTAISGAGCKIFETYKRNGRKKRKCQP